MDRPFKKNQHLYCASCGGSVMAGQSVGRCHCPGGAKKLSFKRLKARREAQQTPGTLKDYTEPK